MTLSRGISPPHTNSDAEILFINEVSLSRSTVLCDNFKEDTVVISFLTQLTPRFHAKLDAEFTDH